MNISFECWIWFSVRFIAGAKFVEAYLTEKKVDKVLIDAKTMKEMEAKLRPPDTTQLFKAVAPLASIEVRYSLFYWCW